MPRLVLEYAVLFEERVANQAFLNVRVAVTSGQLSSCS